MENIQCTTNWVLIKFDNSNEYLKIGDTILQIDTSYEPERRAQVKGIVVNSSKKLFFRKETPESALYNVPIEIKEGDTVLFHFNCVNSAKVQGRLIKEGEEYFMFIRYDQLFAAIREDKIIPLNGWVFVEPLKETIETSLWTPDFKVSQRKGIVKHLGCKVLDYLNYPDQSDETINIQIGDDIVFAEVDAVPIHDAFQTELKGLYRMHRIDIQGIYNKIE